MQYFYTKPWSIDTDELKPFSLDLICQKNVSVENAQEAVHNNEGQQMRPDELEDTAMPNKHQTQKPLAWLASVHIAVAEDIGRITIHEACTIWKNLYVQTNLGIIICVVDCII